MTVSIIIPAHNEEESIVSTIEGVLASVRVPYELIVVLDHCTDRTEERVRSLMEQSPQLRILRNEDRRGSFSNAVIVGFRGASGDIIVPLMADNCDDAEAINAMAVEIIAGRADVVCASRYMKGGKKIGGPLLQGLLSRLVCFSTRLLTGIPTWDVANAYKMYNRRFLMNVKYDMPDWGTEYSMALLFRAYAAGASIKEIPTVWRGQGIPMAQEWRIFRRFPGYWYWYHRAIGRKIKPKE